MQVYLYLNANSECPQRYKEGTVKALIHRTYKIYSDMELFHDCIIKLKQSFVNNGYSNERFDKTLQKYHKTEQPVEAPPTPIKFFTKANLTTCV